MTPESGTYLTPTAIILVLVAFLAGGVSMAYNPLFATSALALVAGVLSLRGATRLTNHVAQGILRAVTIVGIMGALGGIVIILRMGLGMR